ncbi:uracil-DNA glycosylase family protein [Kozakia baliensis]|uniref:Uncharacterized protein n=1 Tax=Kozakia baliensis TaxID=153496 RepID=A0A1D8US23_9PROT|nr:hypothetical protein [Kozakia baliensis]AOX16307.1 hypothetical protein A0U89_03290 [Kozakia baliensis]GBR28544.1 hypothetical protein AA0488_1464 [Kozakia baliensis NRIC 0488]GEL63636.1 hypothetical protein KBA01_09220 [Kozakia baliensis]
MNPTLTSTFHNIHSSHAPALFNGGDDPDIFLIVGLDPWSLQQREKISAHLSKAGFGLVHSAENAFPTRLTALKGTTGPLNIEPIQDGESCLHEEIQSLPHLRAVMTLGITAHIALLQACGIPWQRVPYRPAEITKLPDGLLLIAMPLTARKRFATLEAPLTALAAELRHSDEEIPSLSDNDATRKPCDA